MEVYRELLSLPAAAPLLPALEKKLHATTEQVEVFLQSWGPPLPDKYNTDMLSLLIQSPRKAFVFWEWTKHDYRDYGLMIEDRTTGQKKVASKGLFSLGDFWIEVEPDHSYVAHLVGWTHSGELQTLLSSKLVRTPRETPSENINAVFVDTRDRKRFSLTGFASLDEALLAYLKRMGRLSSINVQSSWLQKVVL